MTYTNVDYLDPKPVRTRTRLVVHSLRGTGRTLVVALAGVGRHRYRVPPPEFLSVSSAGGRHHALLVSDQCRSWMNAPGIAEEMVDLVERYRAEHHIEQVVTLGNSMGGFAAIRLAELTEVGTVIAFSPQFSMHPDLVPEETRWQFHAERIGTWRFKDVGAMVQPGTQYFVFHGDDEAEACHWMRFPWRKEINHFIVTGMDHNLAARLRKRMILGNVVAAAIENRPRVVRQRLEKDLLGRRFEAYRREAFHAAFPERRLAGGGAPAVYPGQSEGSI